MTGTREQSGAPPAGTGPDVVRVRVWDRGVRLFHWSQAALVAAALLTGLLVPTDRLGLHVMIGYAIAGLLAFRLVWGVYGSEYSRFASFLFHPRRAVGHLCALVHRCPPRHLGHNPAGALMVWALFGGVLLLVCTGMLGLGGVYKDGPLAPLVSYATGHRAHLLHQCLAWGLIPMVALHLGGVWVESRLGRENLVRAMIDGRKSLAAGQAVPPLCPARPWPAAVALAVIALGVGLAVFWAGRQPPSGVPTLSPDPTYRAECGACHWAYHPSLLPATSWRQVMAGLADHFGEAADLGPRQAGAIEAWLPANAAESWDTLPANRLRAVDPVQPLRITAAPFWRARHRGLASSVFKSVKGGAGNCAACHRDADTGRFSFQNIHLPTESTP